VLKIFHSFLQLLYPQTCAGCGVSLENAGFHICWECRSALSVITAPLCSVCGEPVHGRVDHDFICHGCVKRPPAFRQARAAIHYNALGKRLVTQFKYSNALWLEPYLVDLLVSCVSAHYESNAYDALCSVPLHPVKRRERGYNQSSLLVKALSRRINVPVLGRMTLRRTRLTPSQTRLTASQRITNVLGAFEVSRPRDWLGKKILLVDDVMTTGATVSACAKAILDAGAEHVDVVTVARGI
jgi:ComF family protein